MHQLLFFLPIVSAIALYAMRLMEMATDRRTIRGQIHENLTLRLFIAVGTLVFFASVAEYALLRHGVISWPLFAAGWCCAILSIVLRRSAIAALGKFWSLHVEIRAEHEFVQSGPFRVVRHPAYLSMIMELVAVPLICHAPLSLIVIPIFFIPVLIRRVRLEESALVEKFGDAYREYQRSTPALLPGLW